MLKKYQTMAGNIKTKCKKMLMLEHVLINILQHFFGTQVAFLIPVFLSATKIRVMYNTCTRN